MPHGQTRKPPTDGEPAVRAEGRHGSGRGLEALNGLEARILTRIQRDFPVAPRPFDVLGVELGLSGDEVRRTVETLFERKLIRTLGPVFDPRALGYVSTLCAASVPADRLDEVAAIINRRPEVTHNYLRDHALNLWFTLITRPAARLAEIIGQLEGETGIVIRDLPAVRLFKIRVEFDFTDGAAATAGDREPPARAGGVSPDPGFPSQTDQAAIRALQEGLPVDERPFAAVAARAGLSEADLLAKVAFYLEHGYVRRLGALVRHRATGITANAMSVWVCPPERMERAGQIMSGFRQVSHCYQRPTFTGWPYSLFAMIHGAAPEECRRTAAEISEATGLTDYQLLYSTRELKKSSMKYFVP